MIYRILLHSSGKSRFSIHSPWQVEWINAQLSWNILVVQIIFNLTCIQIPLLPWDCTFVPSARQLIWHYFFVKSQIFWKARLSYSLHWISIITATQSNFVEWLSIINSNKKRGPFLSAQQYNYNGVKSKRNLKESLFFKILNSALFTPETDLVH